MLCLIPLLLLPAQGADFNGAWELQTLGGDRDVSIEHKGNKLVAHRVMWPEYEGKPYKLEHMFRGTIKGAVIAGDILVKEEELPSFEVLRKFDGKVRADGTLVLDGVGLKRKAAKVDPRAIAEQPTGGPKLADATPPPATQPLSGTPPQPAPTPTPAAPAVAAASPPPPADDEASSLFKNILGTPGGDSLFKVSAAVSVNPEADAHLKRADDELAAKRFREACASYEAAVTAGASRASTDAGLGRCYVKVGEHAKAKPHLERALRRDPGNKELERALARARKA